MGQVRLAFATLVCALLALWPMPSRAQAPPPKDWSADLKAKSADFAKDVMAKCGGQKLAFYGFDPRTTGWWPDGARHIELAVRQGVDPLIDTAARVDWFGLQAHLEARGPEKEASALAQKFRQERKDDLILFVQLAHDDTQRTISLTFLRPDGSCNRTTTIGGIVTPPPERWLRQRVLAEAGRRLMEAADKDKAVLVHLLPPRADGTHIASDEADGIEGEVKTSIEDAGREWNQRLGNARKVGFTLERDTPAIKGESGTWIAHVDFACTAKSVRVAFERVIPKTSASESVSVPAQGLLPNQIPDACEKWWVQIPQSIKRWFGRQSWWTLAGLALLAFFVVDFFFIRVCWQLEHEDRRKALTASLRARSWRRRYERHLVRWLWHMSKPERLGPKPWSPRAYDLCLRLALIYPIVQVFFTWVAWDIDTSGIPGLFQTGILKDGPRWLLAIGLAGCTGLWIWGLRREGLIGFVAVAVAGAFAGAFAVAGAFAFAGAGAFAGAFAVASAFAVAFAVAGAGAGAVAGAGAFAVAVAVAVAVALLEYFSIRRGKQAHFLFFHWFLYAGASVLAVALLAARVEPARLSLLVFYVALPLINVVFDWLSLGATRELLKRSLLGVRSAWLMAGLWLADLGIALALLLVLAVAMAAGLEALNLVSMRNGGERIIDLDLILKRIRLDPGAVGNWWVYGTLFSTFVPSMIHLVILSGSLATSISRMGRPIANRLDDDKRVVPAFLLAIRDVGALVIAAFVIWITAMVLLRVLPGVAPFFLSAAETSAAVMRHAF